MKTFLKSVMLIFIVALASIGGYWAYIQYFSAESNKSALNLIPSDAVFIAETSNLSEAWTEISNSQAWIFLSKNAYFSDINSDIDDLNKYLKANKYADLLLKDRTLTMSVHMISEKEWDFLFVVDLKKTANIVKGNLKTALGFVEGYTITERNYNGNKIIELSDEKNPQDIIYLTLSDNLLVAAFSGILIENAIDAKNEQYWSKNADFTAVVENMTGKNLFKMYVNYSTLGKFSRSYLTEESETLKMITNSLNFSVFDINLHDELLSFKGITGTDSAGSYIKALANVKPAKYTAWQILSDQTSVYFSMSFENYNNFYQKLIDEYKKNNAKDLEDMQKNINLIEKLLGISMQHDFFDWIGSEIAFAKTRPDENTRLEDVLIIFKTNDIDAAKTGLGNIMKKIRRRTPLKFQKEDYKNHEIQCLERKGFFKPFFGKMFAEIEKPYFTFIEDYVVFSNSLENLKSQIDDYVTGNTLSHNSDFSDFTDEFDTKANMSLFLITPKLYENLYYYGNTTDKADIKENRDFILSFANIGFQLVSDNNKFDTYLIAKHNPEAVKADKIELFEKETADAQFKSEIDSLTFKHIFEENKFKTDTFYKEYYTETEILKTEGKIADKNPHGIWIDYYKSGNVKSSVNYEYGKISGKAYFFYDTNPRTFRAEINFENDLITDFYTEFYPNGNIKAKIPYENGNAHGKALFYHKNGQIKIEAEYKNGQKNGKWNYFDENGQQIGTEKWKDNLKIKQKN